MERRQSVGKISNLIHKILHAGHHKGLLPDLRGDVGQDGDGARQRQGRGGHHRAGGRGAGRPAEQLLHHRDAARLRRDQLRSHQVRVREQGGQGGTARPAVDGSEDHRHLLGLRGVGDDSLPQKAQPPDNAGRVVWICVRGVRVHHIAVRAEQHADFHYQRVQGVQEVCRRQHRQQHSRPVLHSGFRAGFRPEGCAAERGHLPERDAFRDTLHGEAAAVDEPGVFQGEVQRPDGKEVPPVHADGSGLGGLRTGGAAAAEGERDKPAVARAGRLVGGDEQDIAHVPDGDNHVVLGVLPAPALGDTGQVRAEAGDIQGVRGDSADAAGGVHGDMAPALLRDPPAVHPGVHAHGTALRLADGRGLLQDMQLAALLADAGEGEDGIVRIHGNKFFLVVSGSGIPAGEGQRCSRAEPGVPDQLYSLYSGHGDSLQEGAVSKKV